LKGKLAIINLLKNEKYIEKNKSNHLRVLTTVQRGKNTGERLYGPQYRKVKDQRLEKRDKVY